MDFRIASYNVHKCMGAGWRRDPGRVVDVINAVGADIVALQEVDLRMGARAAALDAALLKAHSDYVPVQMTRTGPHSLGWHGQVILMRAGFGIAEAKGHGLPGFEPRGALEARISPENGLPFALIAAHLGLRRADRRRQWTALAQVMRGAAPLPALAIGDFNEWSMARGFEPLEGFGVHAPGRSYPARMPVGSLDRIVVGPELRIAEAGVFDTPLSRRASDHLPIWAQVEGAH